MLGNFVVHNPSDISKPKESITKVNDLKIQAPK